MKNILYIAGILLGGTLSAQINVPSNPNVSISGQNPFLDASGYNTFTPSEGKGLLFPSTDLTSFEFNTDVLDGISVFTTAYDGMIVYNTASGSTGSNTAKQGIQVNVTPGFYYFFNPSTVNQGGTSVENGKWVRIGDGSANSKVVLATNGTVVDTNTVIGSTTVKAVKNTITHAGGNSILVDKPAGFTKLYSIKIYKVDGITTTLVGTNLYSYADEGTDKLKLVFGNGIISTSYPKGEYEYVLEYL